MFESISIPRTVASCLPFIGPCIGVYNILGTIHSLDRLDREWTSLRSMEYGQSRIPNSALHEIFGALIRNYTQEIHLNRQEVAELKNKFVPYSKFGIVSSLLTITVTMIALALLKIPTALGLSIIGLSTLAAIIYTFCMVKFQEEQRARERNTVSI